MRKPMLLGTLAVLLALAISNTVAKTESGAMQEAVRNGEAKSYVVLMAFDPAIRYEGGISGYEATKPGKGAKINPQSAHVRK